MKTFEFFNQVVYPLFPNLSVICTLKCQWVFDDDHDYETSDNDHDYENSDHDNQNNENGDKIMILMTTK